ncbi:hypothetical protein BO78DRAFT_329220 [Aspergillus sclerotiicarbonarius CBS 121057]|uniref:Uncharacterized protein n=1 Tax=Aspergillus sclerotiicarbonarius (strain CBS 121057 / IBT 28362) TaxID=1448318 RepID=A0A319E2R5_ASPSB|nr:hypothetical protein BO78DRAFT_329220 [Aspergillus sclerotiicarbonarius CBS 121057]
MLPFFPFYRLLLLVLVCGRLFFFCLSFISVAVALAHRPATVMFQRLRDAIDSRIAEEQARQRSAQTSLSRSNSARHPTSRNISPTRRTSRPRRNTGTPVRGPDPNEFEPEFAIGDDEGPSRSATPRLESAGGSEAAPEENGGEGKATAEESTTKKPEAQPVTEANQSPSDLPPEIRVKLRRLGKLESRYQGKERPETTVQQYA